MNVNENENGMLNVTTHERYNPKMDSYHWTKKAGNNRKLKFNQNGKVGCDAEITFVQNHSWNTKIKRLPHI